MYGAGVGTALVDAQGRFEEVNDALCTILGYSRGDLVGRTFAEVTHPEDVVQSRAGLAELQSGDLETFRIRKRYLTGAGDVVWVDVTANALRGDDGTFLGAITQMVDVTVEVEEFAALTESEARYRLLVENIAEVVFHQADGIVLWISPSVQALLGWTPDDLIGTAHRELWHPDDRGASVAMREAAYAGNRGRPSCGSSQGRADTCGWRWRCARPRAGSAVPWWAPCATSASASRPKRRSPRASASSAYWRRTPPTWCRWSRGRGDHVGVSVGQRHARVGPGGRGRPPRREFVHPDDAQRWSGRRGSPARRGRRRGISIPAGRRQVRLGVGAVQSRRLPRDCRGRVATIRDVDAAVRARLQLQESEERFRLGMDNSAAGMSLVSPTGAFLRVNAALCEFLGRSRDELLSSTWPEVTHPDDLARDPPWFRICWRAGVPRSDVGSATCARTDRASGGTWPWARCATTTARCATWSCRSSTRRTRSWPSGRWRSRPKHCVRSWTTRATVSHGSIHSCGSSSSTSAGSTSPGSPARTGWGAIWTS